MHKTTTAILVAMGLLAGGLWVVSAQSLADIARKEEERRKETKTGKTYTNKDLRAAPPSSTPPPPTATATPAPASSTATSEPSAAKPSDTKDQAYWAGRMKQLVTQLDRDKTYADAMQSRVNALTTDFVNRDDPAQRSVIEADRQKAVAELDRLKNSIADTQKAITQLEEEARRANVPPGWLR
jgi:hypothetical protein